jgi:hypothetical protein
MPENENSTESIEEQSYEERLTKPAFWRKWYEGAKEAAEPHWDEAQAAWDEYQNEPEAGEEAAHDLQNNKRERVHPIYHVSCKIVETAFYSRAPDLTSERSFGINDPAAMTACLINDRLGEYLRDECDFDMVMRRGVLQFIHGDKGCLQALYRAELIEVEKQVPLIQQAEDEFVTQEGEPWKGEVFQSPDGMMFYGVEMVEEADPETQELRLMAPAHDEVLHDPYAKTDTEIDIKGFYFKLEEDEARQKFGKAVADVTWHTSKKDQEKEDKDLSVEEATRVPGRYLEGWECISKKTGKIYWISEQHPEYLIDYADDEYDLQSVFPATDFIISNLPERHMYPMPIYRHVRPICLQLHELTRRIFKLTQAIRRRCIVGTNDPRVIAALNRLDEAEYISGGDLSSIVEKGGLAGIMHWVPVQELVQAITELVQLENHFKQTFYEWFGVPEILRGVGDPVETAAAQELQASSANDRFKMSKRMVRQMARDGLQLLLDLAYKMFSDEKIARIVGFQYMDPAHQQRFPEALALLRNDTERTIRIDIETDSMSYLDRRLARNEMQQTSNVIMEGMKSLASMAQGDPTFLPAGGKILMSVLERMEYAKDFQDDVKGTIDKLIQAKMQPQQPGPDYEQMKIQLQQAEVERKGAADQLKAQIEGAKIKQKDFELVLKQQDMSFEQKLTALREAFNKEIEGYLAGLEGARVQIEEFKARMQAAESQMEEIRLAREAETQQIATIMDSQKVIEEKQNAAPPQIINVSTPPVNVAVEAGRPARRSGRLVYDEFGNATFEITEELPEETI